MDWAPFEPLPEDKLRRQNEERAKHHSRRAIITDVVKRNNFTPLNSPYLDMSSFYYDTSTSFIWQVQNINTSPVSFYRPSYDVYKTIREYNNIKPDAYERQDATLALP